MDDYRLFEYEQTTEDIKKNSDCDTIKRCLMSIKFVDVKEIRGSVVQAERMDILIQAADKMNMRFPRNAYEKDQVCKSHNMMKFNFDGKDKLYESLDHNVCVFFQNKHNHLKARFWNKNKTSWIMIYDKKPTNPTGFQSLYLFCTITLAFIFPNVDFVKFTHATHTYSRDVEPSLENTQTLQRPTVHMNPTKAGVLSRIRHAYDRNIEKWKRPKNKPHSLSRSRTFTRVRIRPEEHFTKEQRMEFLKAFGSEGNEIAVTSPETSLAPKQRFKRMFGLDSKKKARDEYRALAQM